MTRNSSRLGVNNAHPVGNAMSRAHQGAAPGRQGGLQTGAEARRNGRKCSQPSDCLHWPFPDSDGPESSSILDRSKPYIWAWMEPVVRSRRVSRHRTCHAIRLSQTLMYFYIWRRPYRQWLYRMAYQFSPIQIVFTTSMPIGRDAFLRLKNRPMAGAVSGPEPFELF